MRKFVFLILILCSSANFIFANTREEITKIEERTFDFTPGGRIQVSGDAGFIRVESWDKNEVYLRYTKRAWESNRRNAEMRLEDLQVEISDQPGQLSIRQVPGFEEKKFRFIDLFDPDRWAHSRYASRIDFELKVPRQCHLVLEADEGDITVLTIEGEVKIDSDEGNIKVENLAHGEVSLGTDEGEIDCRNLQLEDYRLSLASDEGTQRVNEVSARAVWAEADEGDIILSRVNASGGKLTTDEGDIDLDVERFDDGTWNISADEGDVELFVPAHADADISLESDRGDIRTDFNLRDDSDKNDRRQRQSGRLGEGRARLEIITDEGNISLRRRTS